jgi:ATP-dependent helicase/nuclease subunit B
MSGVDAGKREMGANDFGDLIHIAMQRLAEDSGAAASMDERVIGDFLEAAARSTAHARYGQRLPMLVRLQLESAVQRLRAAAGYEAQSRAEGWRIAEAEVVLGNDAEAHPLLLSGARLRGKIDRVEHRHSGGRVDVRLIDFKTSDKADTPMKAHVRELKGRAKLREEDGWKCFTNAAGKDCQWLDLQLPLYAAAMAERGTTQAGVGYFLLPKGVQDTTLEVWPDFDAVTMQAAVDCAAEVVRRINAGIFWPPAKVKYDAYSELLLGDAAAAVKDVFTV